MKTKTLNEVFEGDFVLEIDESGLPANEPCEATSYNLKELREKVKEGKFVVALPLIGYKVKIPRGVTGDIIKDILEEEEVRLEDFYIKSMPELSVKGTYRAVLLKIRNFEVPEIMRDELSPSMLKTLMCFSVPKGGYATIVLREFMKPHDPVSAGFLISN
jgi:tRNA pseudouridine13 synthase